MKDYIQYEIDRNKKAADLFAKLVQKAFGNCSVMVGHHVAMEFNADLNTENEIPSADTLLFDHDIMTKCFGKNAIPIMVQLASVPAGQRETMLGMLIADIHATEEEADGPVTAVDPAVPAKPFEPMPPALPF